ncbi:unnamed protein product [Adineta steineri]|uniref:G-protein coupled receptors family 1 profile domain-containing protein n=1 Tax=Adineta steineri TaxID=433720 RepID=A0A814IX48_9BILA|nr:unnamed protein product [Adineta steineri]CAF3741711.1 unnamed protein product [Adineta steineri]
MNITHNSSLLTTKANCSLQERVYSSDYLFFKFLNSNYLRILIGPGFFLNTLCIIVLSRPRLSNKSTTIFFLRFLAIFDILAITLKYVRVELNYQSRLYVCMGASISITMWTIVLMSVDKAIAVSYPLKSSIWLTQKRVSYICYLTSLILLLANLSFISFAEQGRTRHNKLFCGLNQNKNPLLLDIITASILPIALTTAANIVIAVTLHYVSRNSFNWSSKKEKSDINRSELDISKAKRSPSPYPNQTSLAAPLTNNTSQVSKRRTSAQVTRMLFAVTLSLILFNLPNSVIYLFSKKINAKGLLNGRDCLTISDYEIKLYQIDFMLSVMQDILSDLPHMVNFFLYCLAGKKFRSIILDEVQHFLVGIHLIKRKQKRYVQANHILSTDSGNTARLNRSQRHGSLTRSLVQLQQL